MNEERQGLPGHVETPIGAGIVLASMAPEARDCLDIAMERWRERRADWLRTRATVAAALGGEDEPDEVYAFAYWLLRYSGLVVARTGDG